jgi:hypothetical protein
VSATDLPTESTTPTDPLSGGFDPTDPNSPLAGIYMHFGHLLALVLLGLYLVYTNLTRIPAPVWSDLKFGQWVSENGRLPDHEPFSTYSDPTVPCVRTDWLGQLIFYRAFRFGERLGGDDPVGKIEAGLEMLRLVHLGLTLLFLLFLLAAYRRQGGSLPLACAGLALLAVAAPVVMGRLRTELLGLVCFAGVLAALSRPIVSRRALLVVPLLCGFWANVHGSFPMGLLLLTFCLFGRIIETARNPLHALRVVAVQRLLLLMALSVGATFLNWYGPGIYGKLLDLYRNPNVGDMPGWGALDFSTWKLTPILMLSTYVLLALTQAASPRSFSATQMAVILTFGVLPLWKARMMVWWFPVVPWLILPHWKAMGEKIGWKWLGYRSVPSLRKTFAALPIAVIFLALLGPATWALSRKPRALAAAVPAETPWRVALQLRANSAVRQGIMPPLAARLRESYPDSRFTGVILTTETTGDFLLWMLPAEWPVFIYDELTCFPAKHWQECQAIYNARADWWELLDRRRINLIVVEHERAGKLAAALHEDSDWEILPDGVDARGQGTSGPLLVAIRRKPIRAPSTAQSSPN